MKTQQTTQEYLKTGIHGGVSVSKLKTTQNQKLFENLFEFF